MADNKLSELTAATSAGATDIFYLVQSSTSKSITAANLFSSVAANIVPSTANTYSLGSNTSPWKQVYVSNSGIVLGAVTISFDTVNGNVVFRSGTSWANITLS